MRRVGSVILALGATLVLSACAGKTTGATNVSDVSATLHASASCDQGQTCTWYWEYWKAQYPRSTSVKTPVYGPVNGPTGSVGLSTTITNLDVDTTYRWVFCGSANAGGTYACVGPNGQFGSTTADPPPDYDTFTTAPAGALAEHWNGTAWTVQATPNPAGAVRSTFGAVSCTSQTACTAVGFSTVPSGYANPLAERWNGTNWTIQPTPVPDGGGQLFGVSCTSATSCTAVGQAGAATPSSLPEPLAEHWDGTSWTIQPTSGLTNALYLSGVSCTSATACTAVGLADEGTLAARWDGTSWTLQSTPSPPPAEYSGLFGVSCAAATTCTAVGSGNGAPLAEGWNGTSWTIQATPSPAQNSLLFDVSCTSSAACSAAGQSPGMGSTSTLVERWDGTSWTVQSTPNPTSDSSLTGVACSSAAACAAVGSYIVSSGGNSSQMTLAEAWGGSSWTVQPTPSPTSDSALSGVFCSSATSCTAVGSQ